MMRALHHQHTAVSLFSFRHLFTPTVIRATSSAINGARRTEPRISLSLHYIRDYECNRDAAAASIFDFICCLFVGLFVCRTVVVVVARRMSFGQQQPVAFSSPAISAAVLACLLFLPACFFIICLVQFIYYCRRCEY